MRPKAYLVHQVPERLRFRVPERRHDEAFFGTLEQCLAKCESVVSVGINLLTSGMLVRYRGDLAALMTQAQAAGLPELVDIEIGPPPSAPVPERLRRQAAQLDRSIRQLTGGEADMRSLVVLGLLAASFVQTLRGRLFGPAIPLLWYASQAMVTEQSAAANPPKAPRPERR